MRPKRKHRRMYAVSCKGRGILSGTMAWSRYDAICRFQGGLPPRSLVNSKAWAESKRKGYRTVKVAVKIVA